MTWRALLAALALGVGLLAPLPAEARNRTPQKSSARHASKGRKVKPRKAAKVKRQKARRAPHQARYRR